MDKTIRLRCIGRQTGLGTVPDAISGGMREREFNVWEFAHPTPPQPPQDATPRQMARYMAMQPTTAAKVELRTIDAEMTFVIGQEYHLSITSDEELRES
jgi:hypothetical protein